MAVNGNRAQRAKVMVGGGAKNDFSKMGNSRLCLFAAGNDPETIERDRMGIQKRKGIMEGKGGAGVWGTGPQREGEVLRPFTVTGRNETKDEHGFRDSVVGR